MAVIDIDYGAHTCRLRSAPDEAVFQVLRDLTVYEPEASIRAAKDQRRKKGPARFAKIETRKWLYHKGQRTFPTGLLVRVLAALPDAVVHGVPALPEALPLASVIIHDEYPNRVCQEEAYEALTPRLRAGGILVTGTGKSRMCALLAGGFPTANVLVTTPNVALLDNNRTEIAGYLRVPVGILGDSQRDLGQRITVSTIQTLASRVEAEDPEVLAFLATVDVLVIDEAQGAAAESYKPLSRALPRAHRRYGLTGTWERTDGCELVIAAVIGEVVYEYGYDRAFADGVLTPIRVWNRSVKPGPQLPHRGLYRRFDDDYKDQITENERRNLQVALDAAGLVAAGLTPVLVFVRQKEHGKLLAELVGCEFINGEDTKSGRVKKVLKGFVAGDYEVLVASGILNVGVNLPRLRSGVNAAAGDSPIDATQKAGRGARLFPGKTHFDYLDYEDGHTVFKKHAINRKFTFVKHFTPARVQALKGRTAACVIEDLSA